MRGGAGDLCIRSEGSRHVGGGGGGWHVGVGEGGGVGAGASQCGWGRGDRGRWRAIGAWGSEGVATGQEARGDRAEGGHGRVSLTLLSVPRATEALMGSQDPRVTRERKGSE